MSITYSFVCDDCKVKCWAGQSTYIYGYDYIANFLYDHIGHKIRFLNDHHDDELSEDYIEVDTSNHMKFVELSRAVKDVLAYSEQIPLSLKRKNEIIKIFSDFIEQYE